MMRQSTKQMQICSLTQAVLAECREYQGAAPLAILQQTHEYQRKFLKS